MVCWTTISVVLATIAAKSGLLRDAVELQLRWPILVFNFLKHAAWTSGL